MSHLFIYICIGYLNLISLYCSHRSSAFTNYFVYCSQLYFIYVSTSNQILFFNLFPFVYICLGCCLWYALIKKINIFMSHYGELDTLICLWSTKTAAAKTWSCNPTYYVINLNINCVYAKISCYRFVCGFYLVFIALYWSIFC